MMTSQGLKLVKEDILFELNSQGKDDDVSSSSSSGSDFSYKENADINNTYIKSEAKQAGEGECLSSIEGTQTQYKSESEYEPSSSEDSNESADSPEWKPQIKKMKKENTSKVSLHRKNIFTEDDNATERTAFEAERQKNIEERMRFFNELALDEAKKALLEATRGNSKKSRVAVTSANCELRQKSSRIKAIQIKEESSTNECFINKGTKKSNLSQTLTDIIFTPFDNADFTQYFENLNNKLNSEITMQDYEMDFSKSNIEDFETKLQSLKLRDEQNMKLLPSAITALKFHPSESAMLIGAGGKSGTLGLWNVNVEAGDWDDSNIIVFQLHKFQVNCISFSNFDSSIMYTSSYDGILYKGDLNKKIFEPIYVTDDKKKSQLYYHCERDANTLFAAQDNGVVSKTDKREKMGSQEQFRLHHDTVRTISIIPHQPNLMVTCSDDAAVSMWDLRNMTKKGMCGRLWNLNMDKGVASAFISPINGKRILITLPCNTFCIYDTQQGDGTPFRSWEVQPKGRIYSKPLNYPLKAVWHPQREDFFSVARTCAPYGIEVYRCNYSMESLAVQRQSVILETQKSALTEFHPSYPAVATSCTSNVHLFL